MTCKCGSTRILRVGGKCNDCSTTHFGELEIDGYVPHIKGIGGGDYINISVCADCGVLQGFKPMTDEEITEVLEK